MQVLGMLPKKERKTKKPAPVMQGGAMSDPGLLLNKLKPRASMTGPIPGKMGGHTITPVRDDMEDVYAFPPDNDKLRKEFTALVPNSTSVSVVGIGGSHFGAVNRSSTDSSSGQSSLAKIYPELAEKLEKIKPKIEPKLKGKVKSSRTMNSLQTKIAQNKIKDKLKRNQSPSNASSQSQSPSYSFNSSSPGYHVNTSSPNHVIQHTVLHKDQVSQAAVTTNKSTGIDKIASAIDSNQTALPTTTSSVPSLSNLNVMNGLNLQSLNLSLEQLGLPVQAVSDIEQTLKQLAKAANIHLEENAPVEDKNHHIVADLLAVTQTPFTNLNLLPEPPPPYSGPHHKPTATILHQASSSITSSPVKADPAIGQQSMPIASSNSAATVASTQGQTSRQLFTNLASVAPGSTVTMTPLTSALQAPAISTLTSPFPAFPNTVQHQKLTLLTATPVSTSTGTKMQEKGPETIKQLTAILPPPPKPKPKAKQRSRNASAASGSTKRSVPLFTMPMTLQRPRKMRKIFEETKKKLSLPKPAFELCEKSLKRKSEHHYLIYSGLFLSYFQELK